MRGIQITSVKRYFGNKRENAKKANEHFKLMSAEYPEEIDSSIHRSVIYGPEMINLVEAEESSGPRFHLISGVHQDFIRDATLSEDTVCVHNFASYRNPGGMFIKGSSAQEESLCHASTLYNVLSELTEFYDWNNKHCYDGLYADRAIYSPDIIFRYEDAHLITGINIDVLTCAAPNATAMKKKGIYSKSENYKALEHRIDFICRILDAHKVHTFITGAWGCGVFGQDPEQVALLLHMYLQRTNIREVYFVIPKGYQYKMFYNTLRGFLDDYEF